MTAWRTFDATATHNTGIRQSNAHRAASVMAANRRNGAADRVVAVLRRHGVHHALVSTGEIGTIGGKGEQDHAY